MGASPAVSILEFERYIRQARELRSKIQRDEAEADQCRLALLLLLVELRSQELLWLGAYPTWAALLKAEKLVSLSIYRDFERALRTITVHDVLRFGVTASLTLMKVTKETRTKVLKTVRTWHNAQVIQPTFKEVARFVWRERTKIEPVQRHDGKKLMAYIEVLKKQLREHGIRPHPSP